MAKRQNYGFQKRQKETEKQKKRDEKAEKKRARREEAAEGAGSGDGEGGGESDEESEQRENRPVGAGHHAEQGVGELDERLPARLATLFEEGWDLWARFDIEVRQRDFHPFVAADYEVVLAALLPLRGPGLKFLEWGSAMGVITIMADLVGFEAYGIELDPDLVEQARDLARRTGSAARFTAGSFLPAGYRWKDRGGDARLGTIGQGESGYLQLGMPLEEFDVVFGYPWAGEEAMMLDLMRVHGRADAIFLLHTGGRVKVFRSGVPVA